MLSRIPPEVRREVEATLGARTGRPARLVSARPVGGGCVSAVARLETEAGDVAFLKWSPPGDRCRGLFEAEAQSLEALRAAGAITVPAVLGASDPDWLLLEWLEPGRPTARTWSTLGRALARLHRTSGERYGWPSDNFIGTLPQANGWSDDWPSFWRERRLLPQLERAYRGGYFSSADRRLFDRLLSRLDEFLADAAADGPSLLHGDLWSGNVHVLADGSPALIDPSSYYGHREVDLAMSELFGGFGAEFYRAYEEEWPVDAGYRSVRRGIYQLYYLLVHVNLFGGGYVAGTVDVLRSIG